MLRGAFRLFTTLIFFILFAHIGIPSAFAEHDPAKEKTTLPAPPPRAEGDAKVADVDTLKKQVKEDLNSNTPAWWRAAHDLLGKLSKEDAQKFGGEIAAGSRQDLFKELTNHRFNDDSNAVRGIANGKTAGPGRDAARQEILRRLSDPNNLFIAQSFAKRPETSMTDTQQLLKAPNDKDAAVVAARLMGQINKVQREALLKRLEEVKKGGEAEKLGLDRKMIDRLVEATQVATGGKADSAFQKEFDPLYKGILEKNRRFHENVAKAAAGDAKAREELLRDYNPEDVMDFIAGQVGSKNDGVAVDVAKAFARRDSAGNLFFDMAAANAAFGDGPNRNQVLFLGNEKQNEEIRAALTAFHFGGAEDHDEAAGGDPKTQSRFQRFTIDPNANTASPVRVFAKTGTPRPVLTRTTDTGRPTGEVAKERIETPNTPPPATENPPPPGGPVAYSEAAAQALVAANCVSCHKGSVTGNTPATFRFTTDGGTFSLAETIRHVTAGNARMVNGVSAAVKAQLQAWAETR